MGKGVKKTFSIILNVLLIIFIILSTLGVIAAIINKKTGDDALTIGNTQTRLVLTESMEANPLTDVSSYEIKDIPVNSLVFIEVIDKNNKDAFYDSLKVGDVLTFEYYMNGRIVIITHRLIGKESKETGGYILTLRGDNINSDGSTSCQTIDTSLSDVAFNKVIGKVTYVEPTLGNIITFLKSPIGLVMVVIIPCLILIGFETVKVISILNKEKKEIMNKKDKEIDELKERLKMLENKE